MSDNNVRYLNPIVQAPDHILFSIALFGGMAWLVIARLLIKFPASVTAVGLVLLMGVYALIIWKSERYQLRGDRAADNLYYLGFLFTISALGVSLWRFGESSDGQVEEIIQDLGVALVTTLVGLALRLYFNLLRTDPEEIEARMRLELIEVAERTRSALHRTQEAVEEVATYSHQILRESKERLDLAQETVVESIEGLAERVEAIDIPENLVTSRLNPPLTRAGAAIDSFSEQVEAVDIPNDVVQQQIGASFEAINNTLSIEITRLTTNISDRLDAIDIPANIFVDNVQPLLVDLRNAVQRVTQGINAIEISPDILDDAIRQSFEGLRTATDEIAQSMAAIPALVGALQQRFQEIRDQLGVMGPELNQGQEALAEALDSMAESLQGQGDAINLATYQITEFRTILETAVGQVQTLGQAIHGAVEPIGNVPLNLDQLQTSIEQAQTATANTMAAFQQANAAATHQVQALADEIEELASQFANAMNELVTAAQADTDQP